MKRSRTVALTLMMGTATSLSACGDPPDEIAFTGPLAMQECTDSGASTYECQTAYDAALLRHREEAPRFESMPACVEATDSECESIGLYNADGTFQNVFVPALAGFLLARALQNRDDRYHTYIGGTSYRSSPIYRSRTATDSYRVVTDYGGLKNGTSLSTAKPSVSLPPANVKTTTVSRGGFGKFGGGLFSGGG